MLVKAIQLVGLTSVPPHGSLGAPARVQVGKEDGPPPLPEHDQDFTAVIDFSAPQFLQEVLEPDNPLGETGIHTLAL